MIASTWLDLVVGLDIHFEMVPMPAPVPTPFPHPFVGMVFDPAGLAMGLAISNTIGMIRGGSFKGPVLIWGMPANTTGTEAKNSFVLPHFIIPPGTMWTPMPKAPKPPFKGKTRPPDLPVAPAGDAVMITGSKTVTTMGTNQCRLGDLAMSCAEPVRLPSSAVIAIPKGPLVLVGGPPAVDWMAAAMAFIKTKTIANELHGLVGRIKNPRLRNICHWVVCTLTGHPVDVATGRVMTRATDWELPGPIPLTFERHYSSAWSNRDSPLGWGWSHSLDQAVWIERGCVVYRAGDGREIEFDTFSLPDRVMRPGDEVWDAFNRLTLRNTAPFTWEVVTHEGLTHHFAPARGGGSQKARLTRITDRAGNEVLLTYDPRGALDYVRDACGRIVRFEHDDRGRLARVSLPHPSAEAWVTHTRYTFSAEGELAAVTDALDHASRFEYAGEHLLVRETDRNGFSFYFGYDGGGTDARCVRTWGDDGVYDHVLFYDPRACKTTVTDSVGSTTLYEFNELNLITRRTDPEGNVWEFGYTPQAHLAVEQSPLGHRTRWSYDARGNVTAIERPDGAVTTFVYDDLDQPVTLKDSVGREWRREYTLHGEVKAEYAPDGSVVTYDHDERALLRAVLLSTGDRIEHEYDAHRNLTSTHGPAGTRVRYAYDRRGRVVEQRDGAGVPVTRRYDAVGRVVETTGPTGHRRSFDRLPEGQVAALTDDDGVTRFRYGAWNQVVEHVTPDGAVTRARYDTEQRIVEVTNPAGERHQITYDACGRVATETDYAGRLTRYGYDPASRMVMVTRPGGGVVRAAFDACDRLLSLAYPGGREDRFEWLADGSLGAACNEWGDVRFERDHLGRVTEEVQGDAWVRSRYNAAGTVRVLASSSGAKTSVHRNGLGDVTSMGYGDAHASWEVTFRRDARGAELERWCGPRLGLRTERDATSHPTSLAVLAQDGAGRALAFAWDARGRLSERGDSARVSSRILRDARGVPQAIVRGAEERERVYRDAADNPYRSGDGSDRTYGAGGTLLTFHGAVCEYDAEGRTTARHLPGGAAWRYRYDGRGHLVEVERPDGERVSFAYDALGRRVEKRFRGVTTRWVWDEDVVLHELRDGAEAVTWLFEPDTMRPMARVEGPRRLLVVADPIGAPALLVDERGEAVWESEARLTGILASDVRLCPWRWPGQYEDEETGLYYNRFRYYDPAVGQYLTPDPVGLEGGLNPYGYVLDTTASIDPWGLAGDCVTYYHATDDVSAGLIKKGIKPSKGRVNLDFNPSGRGGFYVTTSRAQAEQWAQRIAQRTGNRPAVVVFEVPRASLATLETRVFASGDRAWADFVVAGRNGTLNHSFDAVRGPMLANPRGVTPATARPIGQQTAIFTDKAAQVFDQSLTGVRLL